MVPVIDIIARPSVADDVVLQTTPIPKVEHETFDDDMPNLEQNPDSGSQDSSSSPSMLVSVFVSNAMDIVEERLVQETNDDWKHAQFQSEQQVGSLQPTFQQISHFNADYGGGESSNTKSSVKAKNKKRKRSDSVSEITQSIQKQFKIEDQIQRDLNDLIEGMCLLK